MNPGKTVYKYDSNYNLLKKYSSVKEAVEDNAMCRATMYQYINSGKSINGNIYARKSSTDNNELITQLLTRKNEIECELKKINEFIND